MPSEPFPRCDPDNELTPLLVVRHLHVTNQALESVDVILRSFTRCPPSRVSIDSVPGGTEGVRRTLRSLHHLAITSHFDL